MAGQLIGLRGASRKTNPGGGGRQTKIRWGIVEEEGEQPDVARSRPVEARSQRLIMLQSTSELGLAEPKSQMADLLSRFLQRPAQREPRLTQRLVRKAFRIRSLPHLRRGQLGSPEGGMPGHSRRPALSNKSGTDALFRGARPDRDAGQDCRTRLQELHDVLDATQPPR
jgi:hypothetical protein